MANSWAEKQWNQAPLGDKRLEKRAIKIGEACLRSPNSSIPKKFGTWADTKGAYRFFDSPSVTHQALQKVHNKNVIDAASVANRCVLFIQDGSELLYNDHPYTNGLGPTADSSGQGILFHTCLAVEWSIDRAPEVLGIAKQIAWIRPERSERDNKEKRKKESQVWLDTLLAIGQPPKGVQWVSVGDRGNDIFEYMQGARNSGWEYVLRGRHDRTVIVHGEEKKLHNWIRGIAAGAEYELNLRSRGSKPSRLAHLKISWGEVVISPPSGKGESGITGTCVRAYDPDDDELEWILITSLKVDSAADALRIIKMYEQRWIIEEYHKCLKTGCRIEQAQLKTAGRLLALLGILGVVATQLLWLRDISRQHPDSPAHEYVENDVIDAVKRLHKLTGTITVRELWRRIAMLGGFLGRKSDKDPGWQTIWSGWLRVQDVLTGMMLARTCG